MPRPCTEGKSVSKDTSPVGVPVPLLGVTPTVMLADAPWVKVVGVKVRVVVVGLNVTVFQLFARLVTFTEPNPDARSYPTLL